MCLYAHFSKFLSIWFTYFGFIVLAFRSSNIHVRTIRHRAVLFFFYTTLLLLRIYDFHPFAEIQLITAKAGGIMGPE